MKIRVPIPRLSALAALLTTLILAGSSVADHDGRTQAPARPSGTAPTGSPHHGRPLVLRVAALPVARVTISSGVGTPLPRSFLGLSTEYWTIPLFARHLRLFERALALLRVPGDGPVVLRIGGDSADHTFWEPRMRRMPRWAFRVGHSWLRLAGLLVRREHLKLILDLNLVTGSSPGAAAWARAAARHLPQHSIIGFEIGNEPDIYDRWDWLQNLGTPQAGAPLLPRHLSSATYISDFRTYARALARVAPQVPLVAPAIANPTVDLNWLSGLITGAHPGLGLVSAHRYPYSACVRHSSATYPSIGRVLSDNATVGLARAVTPAVRLAEHAGFPFRLTELNSVTCGGVPGISDTFATALWAPDALFSLLKAGVDGANVHVRAYAVNAAFAFDRQGLQARPLLYGLLMFTRVLGPHAQLVPAQLQARPALRLKAWAVRLGPSRMHVLLIDKGPRAARVELRVPAAAPIASVQRLSAPAVTSHTGVTLAGQTVDNRGRWHGALVTEPVVRSGGGYTLTLPRMSAALVTLNARPGALFR